jgi:GNAT superfamily N-acetyltransferase
MAELSGDIREAVALKIEPADSAAAVAVQEAFYIDIAQRYPGWTPASSQAAIASDFEPPHGAWFVAYMAGRAAGCGGVQQWDAQTAEIRRVFLEESARGQGFGRALLTGLEAHARELGYLRVRLTTGDGQPEALGLFQSAGYREIAPFTDGVFTRHWMEKPLI